MSIEFDYISADQSVIHCWATGHAPFSAGQYTLTLSDQGGGVQGTQDLFFTRFTTFACAFLTVIFSNCLTIGYAFLNRPRRFLAILA